MSLTQLRGAASGFARGEIKRASQGDPAFEVNALRWYHRGLPTNWAVYKVKVGFEASERANGRRPPPAWTG